MQRSVERCGTPTRFPIAGSSTESTRLPSETQMERPKQLLTHRTRPAFLRNSGTANHCLGLGFLPTLRTNEMAGVVMWLMGEGGVECKKSGHRHVSAGDCRVVMASILRTPAHTAGDLPQATCHRRPSTEDLPQRTSPAPPPNVRSSFNSNGNHDNLMQETLNVQRSEQYLSWFILHASF